LEYSEEQILIRSVPCPSCGAQPRQFCFRPPKKTTGKISSHNERMLLWHKVVNRWKEKKNKKGPLLGVNGPSREEQK